MSQPHPGPVGLASSSPYRRQLLAQLLPQFDCQNPAIDEAPQGGESAEQLVTRLAQSKAAEVAKSRPNCLIIGSDQVALLDRDILTKPGNFDNAYQQLAACSGHEVLFLTGLCVLNSHNGQYQTTVEPCRVKFRKLTDADIRHYLMIEQPFDCAGSFKAEGLGISLFEYIRSDDPNSLIGLPLIKLNQLLAKFGFNCLQAHPPPAEVHQ